MMVKLHLYWYKILVQLSPPLGHPICQDIVATLERWPLVRGRSKYFYSRTGKDMRPHWRGCPLLSVATKRETAVLYNAESMHDAKKNQVTTCLIFSFVFFSLTFFK